MTLVVLSQIALFVCSSIAAKMAGFHYEDQATVWACLGRRSALFGLRLKGKRIC